ncbi:hypothetical protein D3C71_1818170 [compost metagenome]
MCRARTRARLPSGVGCRPRPVRMKSGAPKMSSSSARALVTAGWLMPAAAATRVSDPCRAMLISSARWRCFRRFARRAASQFMAFFS